MRRRERDSFSFCLFFFFLSHKCAILGKTDRAGMPGMSFMLGMKRAGGDGKKPPIQKKKKTINKIRHWHLLAAYVYLSTLFKHYQLIQSLSLSLSLSLYIYIYIYIYIYVCILPICQFLFHSFTLSFILSPPPLPLSLSLYIYIYIYSYVCVRVCTNIYLSDADMCRSSIYLSTYVYLCA